MKKYLNFKSVREGLERNKIFFEVGAATALSIMAIIISFQANKIAETQTRIMEQENMPQIEVKRTQERNDSTKYYENNIYMVFNRGGKLTDFDFKCYGFIKISKWIYEEEDRPLLPVYNYYNERGTLSGEGDGLIYQMDNIHNNVKFKQLNDSLESVGYIEIVGYAKITYTDLFDTRHTEFYRLDPTLFRVDEVEWESHEMLFKSDREKNTFLHTNASNLIKMIKK